MANGIARAQAQGRGFRVGPNFTPRQVKLQKGPGGPSPVTGIGGRINPATRTRISGPLQQGSLQQADGNIGRFTRPSGFRGLAGARGINPATETRISGPGVRVGPLQRGPGAPAINLGGGREFRNAGQQNRQRQTPAGGGAINLAALGVKPMRNPGVFATLAGRRAANAAGNYPNMGRRTATRFGQPGYRGPRTGAGGFKQSNPVARAAARGRGF